MFKINKKGSVEYYTINSFEDAGLVKHCFTTKRGGVSKDEYAEMNLRLNCSDDINNVRQNFKIISDTIGIDYKKLVFSNQVHEDNIYTVTKNDIGKGLTYPVELKSADGLICAYSGVPIVTFYADCVPLFFLDKKNKVMALSHSGWKGTIKRIGQKTIQKMKIEYNSQPEDILCAIGPSIGVCHFEVGDDIKELFKSEFGDSVIEKKDKYHVNMQKAILMQFESEGIPVNNITSADICTYCNYDTLFSHRKTNGRRGNMAAIMQLI